MEKKKYVRKHFYEPKSFELEVKVNQNTDIKKNMHGTWTWAAELVCEDGHDREVY